jgi:DNA-binding Xre family transcriptional regulator
MTDQRKLRNRLLFLLTEKERVLGRRIPQSEVARAIGVSEQLVARWVKNQVRQFDGEVIEKLCAYFNCEVGDLLYIERGNR